MFLSFCLYFTFSVPEIVSVDGNELSEVAVDGALFSDVELRVLAMQGRVSYSPMHVGFHICPFMGYCCMQS